MKTNHRDLTLFRNTYSDSFKVGFKVGFMLSPSTRAMYPYTSKKATVTGIANSGLKIFCITTMAREKNFAISNCWNGTA